MHNKLRWAAVILAATAVDLGVRFGLRPDFRISLWVEGAVLLLAAVTLLGLYRRAPARQGWRRGLQVLLIAAFALAALRSLMWASGRPVTRANLTILVLGLAGWAFWKYRQRKMGRASDPADGQETKP